METSSIARYDRVTLRLSSDFLRDRFSAKSSKPVRRDSTTITVPACPNNLSGDPPSSAMSQRILENEISTPMTTTDFRSIEYVMCSNEESRLK